LWLPKTVIPLAAPACLAIAFSEGGSLGEGGSEAEGSAQIARPYGRIPLLFLNLRDLRAIRGELFPFFSL